MSAGFFPDRQTVHIRVLAKLCLPLCFVGFLNACALQLPDNRGLQLVSGSAPIYPAELKSRGTEGAVTVQYDVTAQGEVINVRVIASDPPGLFDDAALIAVRTWVFRPQIRVGRAQSVTDITSKLAFQKP
jgi:TonB family protein